MDLEHVVEQGECLASIAEHYGFVASTIWDDPANQELKALRKTPFVLMPGDEVSIPDRQPRFVGCCTGKRHVFRRRDVPEKLRLQLLDAGEPRRSISYTISIDDDVREGITDEQGRLVEWIPPNAREALLMLADDEAYVIQLGGLDPVIEPSGLADRLRNHPRQASRDSRELTVACPACGSTDSPLRKQRCSCGSELGVCDDCSGTSRCKDCGQLSRRTSFKAEAKLAPETLKRLKRDRDVSRSRLCGSA